MKLAVIIPVYNRRETTLNCLSQLKDKVVTNGANIQIIVVDDGSTDGTYDAVKESYPEAIVLRGNGNLWWTGGVNVGVQYALDLDFDSVLILNDDLELDENFLVEIQKIANENPEALVSSVKLAKRTDGKEQIIAAGFNVVGFLKEIERLNADKIYEPGVMGDVVSCDILTGASLFVPISVFKKIGIFDAKKYPHHWGDFEFTRRASLSSFKCLVAVKSKIYGDYNQNYARPFLLNSTRSNYVKSLFNNTRYYHGFVSMYRSSHMHKNIILGIMLYSRMLIGLFRNLFFKIILPAKILRNIYQ